MSAFLGIDTSNYTTSAALFDSEANTIIQSKKLLPVKAGELGLRQSDAVFAHVKQLGNMVQNVFDEYREEITAIGVSTIVFASEMAANCLGAALKVPVLPFAHQQGHVAAALYSAGRLDLFRERFIAFKHFSALIFNAGKAAFRALHNRFYFEFAVAF